MNAIGQLIKKVIGNDKGKKRELALAIAPPGTKKTETALRRLFELINAAERLDAYAHSESKTGCSMMQLRIRGNRSSWRWSFKNSRDGWNIERSLFRIFLWLENGGFHLKFTD